jgi:hypothetical protein
MMTSTPNYTIGDDHSALESLNRKVQVVKDHVVGVITGRKTGLYAWGGAGVGKTYTIVNQLAAMNASYHIFNGRMSAKGLWLALKHAPDAIHLLDDLGRLTKDATAQGILLGALWAQPGHERVVTWNVANEDDPRFVFRGGIIMTANRPLAAMSELQAVHTRIEVYKLDPTDVELIALMRHLAAQGYTTNGRPVLEPDECHEVTEYLLAQCKAAGCPLDLRLQQKSYQTFLQWEAGEAVISWRDLIVASIHEAAHHFAHDQSALGAEDPRRERRNILRAIMQQAQTTNEQLHLYMAQTGASRADFSRRKLQIESGKFDAEDNDSQVSGYQVSEMPT